MSVAKSLAIPALTGVLIAGIAAFATPGEAAPPPAGRAPAAAPMATRLPAAPAYVRSTPITAANAWLSGATQPYKGYPNAGISSANAWNSGVNQPYNQYHCVPNVGLVGANGVCP
jgi:hypothetical protein